MTERFAALLAATHQLVWAADAEGHVTEALHWTPYTGQATADALGQGWLAAVHPADRDRVATAWDQALGTHRFGEDLRLRRHDGLHRWFRAAGAPVMDPDGTVREWVVSFHDVHEERRALARSAEAQAIAQVGSWEWDLLTDRSVWSDEMFRILGTARRDEVDEVSAHFQDIHPDDLPRVQAAIQAALAGQGPYDTSYRVTRPDGRVVVVHARGKVNFDEAGRAIRMVGTLQDVTELRAAEAALSAANAQLQAYSGRVEAEVKLQTERLLEAQRVARIGSWEWAVAADVVTWSDELYRLAGVPVGLPLTYEVVVGHVHPEDRERYRALIETGITGGTPWVFDYRALHPDGGVLVLEARGHAVYGADGRPEVCRGTAQDVTARRAAEAEIARRSAELEQANAELKQLDTLKDQFLAVVSHELRTPINAIMGFASILSDAIMGELTERQHHYVQRILSSSDLLLALIDDLLDMSRITAGKFALSAGPVSFVSVASETLATLAPIAEQRGHPLINEVPPDLPAIWGDPQRLGQVLINLITNALKYTPAGCTVRLRARLAGERLHVEVADDGPGIAPEDQSKLFRRFSQLEQDPGNTRTAKGTGLGLSIVKALVEAHGGEVGVQSLPGQGATFWFTVPVAGRDGGG